MRNLSLTLGLLLIPAGLWGAAGSESVIKREVGKCALAWQRSDYAGIVSWLPARVIQQRGGRAAVLQETKAQFEQARALGVELMEAIPGVVPPPRRNGPWLTTVIPVTAILHGGHLDLTQQTQVLGLSSDQGKHWQFVLLYQVSPQEFNAWFPDLAGRVTWSKDPPPQVDFAY